MARKLGNVRLTNWMSSANWRFVNVGISVAPNFAPCELKGSPCFVPRLRSKGLLMASVQTTADGSWYRRRRSNAFHKLSCPSVSNAFSKSTAAVHNDRFHSAARSRKMLTIKDGPAYPVWVGIRPGRQGAVDPFREVVKSIAVGINVTTAVLQIPGVRAFGCMIVLYSCIHAFLSSGPGCWNIQDGSLLCWGLCRHSGVMLPSSVPLP
eukprot:9358946-Pyramimonas_sp.AAC.4